jgi:glycine betaine/proline transport system substrate-binding protein
MNVSKRLLALMSALVVAILVLAGCGGGGGGASSTSGGTLTLGNIGWTENVAVANLTKTVLEEDFDYKEVELKTLDVGLLFEGVAGGDLDAFQDVWMPNHTQLLAEVENDVKHLKPWYEGQTSFGLAVPSYMKGVNSIADLNQSGAERIIGIEPGAVISTKIEENVIPEYNLTLEHEPSSTAAMLAEVERLYNDKEEFVFPPWCPHPMCSQFDFRYLEDPKNAQGNLDQPAKISAIVNEDLPDDDPVAYAFINSLRLNQDELISLENEIAAAGDNPAKGVQAWLKENRDVVQPAIDAAKQAHSLESPAISCGTFAAGAHVLAPAANRCSTRATHLPCVH